MLRIIRLLPRGSISVLLSNRYLHYVLDLWFEKIVKPKLNGESHLVRFIDNFIICFQYRENAIQFQKSLKIRLAKFSLTLELSKTRMVELGPICYQAVKAMEGKVTDCIFSRVHRFLYEKPKR